MITDDVYDVTTDHMFLELPGLVPGIETVLKLEGLNPAGSIKLKTARELIRNAEAQGRTGPGTELIESTSGNLGVALAAICARKNYAVTLVTDPHATARNVRTMRALGARVVVVRERDANGGFLQTRIDYILHSLRTDPQLVWLNQYANPANAEAHRKYTAREILEGFGVPDWLFIGTGTSGTLMGCVRHLQEAGASTTVVAVDSLGSVTFGGPAGRRWIPGIGSSRQSEILSDDGAFRKALIAEADTVHVCRKVARDYGILPGGSTGTALAAVLAVRDDIPPGSRVLVLSPDLGERYLDSIYDDHWVADKFGSAVLARLGTDQVTVSNHYGEHVLATG